MLLANAYSLRLGSTRRIQTDLHTHTIISKVKTHLIGYLKLCPLSGGNPLQEPLTYLCKCDLDCVYKTSDNKEVYRLEKTKGTEYNLFQLKVYLQFIDGSQAVLFPYEFVLKSGKTVKCR